MTAGDGSRPGDEDRRRAVRDRVIAEAWSSACPPSALSVLFSRVGDWFSANVISIGVVVCTQRTPRSIIGRRVSVLTIESGTRVFVLGWMSLDRVDLQRVTSRPAMMRIRVLGWLRIADDVEARLATETLASVRVFGCARMPSRVRVALGRTAS